MAQQQQMKRQKITAAKRKVEPTTDPAVATISETTNLTVANDAAASTVPVRKAAQKQPKTQLLVKRPINAPVDNAAQRKELELIDQPPPLPRKQQSSAAPAVEQQQVAPASPVVNNSKKR